MVSAPVSFFLLFLDCRVCLCYSFCCFFAVGFVSGLLFAVSLLSGLHLLFFLLFLCCRVCLCSSFCCFFAVGFDYKSNGEVMQEANWSPWTILSTNRPFFFNWARGFGRVAAMDNFARKSIIFALPGHEDLEEWSPWIILHANRSFLL